MNWIKFIKILIDIMYATLFLLFLIVSIADKNIKWFIVSLCLTALYMYTRKSEKCPHCKELWTYKLKERLKEKDKEYENYKDKNICELFALRTFYDCVDYKKYVIRECKRCKANDKIYKGISTEKKKRESCNVCKYCGTLNSIVTIDSGIEYLAPYEKVSKHREGSIEHNYCTYRYTHTTYRPYKKWETDKCSKCGQSCTYIYDEGEENLDSWSELKKEPYSGYRPPKAS